MAGVDREVIRAPVHETLTAMGVDVEHPQEAQADMAFLRRWRRLAEKSGTRALLTFITIIVGGLVALGLMMFNGGK